MDTGNRYNTGNFAETDGEPGAVSNRLSLDVSDPKFTFAQNWEDGKTYRLASVEIRQVSPGEFEVMEATEGGEAEGAGDADSGVAEAGEAETGGMGNQGQAYPNPAIDRMARM